MTTTTPEVRARTRPRPLELETHEGTIEVRRAAYGGRQEVANREKIRVPLFTEQAARVSVGGSISKEMADGTWLRVEVRIELPCYPEVSELRRVNQLCSDLVDEALGDEMVRAGIAQPASQGVTGAVADGTVIASSPANGGTIGPAAR